MAQRPQYLPPKRKDPGPKGPKVLTPEQLVAAADMKRRKELQLPPSRRKAYDQIVEAARGILEKLGPDADVEHPDFCRKHGVTGVGGANIAELAARGWIEVHKQRCWPLGNPADSLPPLTLEDLRTAPSGTLPEPGS